MRSRRGRARRFGGFVNSAWRLFWKRLVFGKRLRIVLGVRIGCFLACVPSLFVRPLLGFVLLGRWGCLGLILLGSFRIIRWCGWASGVYAGGRRRTTSH